MRWDRGFGYQKALELALVDAGLEFVAKPRTRCELIHLGEVADVFEPDLVVENRLILEIKSLRAGLSPASYTQILSYLKFWKHEVGILVNFAASEAVIKRVVYRPEELEPEESYDYIEPLLTDRLRSLLRPIRASLLSIHKQFGLGYRDTTYRKLIDIDLRNRGMNCVAETVVSPIFSDRELAASPITPLVVDGSVLIEVEALHEEITARAIRTMQSHLRFTGAQLGLVVNFGKNRFEIRGVRPLKQDDD